MNKTQELLNSLKDSIDNFNLQADEWEEMGVTKEDLERDYYNFKYISETLDITEIMLLYYLRLCTRGCTQRFYDVAKKLYNAQQDFRKLSDIMN